MPRGGKAVTGPRPATAPSAIPLGQALARRQPEEEWAYSIWALVDAMHRCSPGAPTSQTDAMVENLARVLDQQTHPPASCTPRYPYHVKLAEGGCLRRLMDAAPASARRLEAAPARLGGEPARPEHRIMDQGRAPDHGRQPPLPGRPLGTHRGAGPAPGPRAPRAVPGRVRALLQRLQRQAGALRAPALPGAPVRPRRGRADRQVHAPPGALDYLPGGPPRAHSQRGPALPMGRRNRLPGLRLRGLLEQPHAPAPRGGWQCRRQCLGTPEGQAASQGDASAGRHHPPGPRRRSRGAARADHIVGPVGGPLGQGLDDGEPRRRGALGARRPGGSGVLHGHCRRGVVAQARPPEGGARGPPAPGRAGRRAPPGALPVPARDTRGPAVDARGRGPRARPPGRRARGVRRLAALARRRVCKGGVEGAGQAEGLGEAGGRVLLA